MKKIWFAVLALALCLALAGCKPEDQGVKVQGHVMVLQGGGYMLLMEDEHVGYSPVTMSFRSKESEWPEGLKSGDIVEITYDGMIMETYPGQIIIDKCEKVSDGTLDEVPAELLADLADMGWKPTE